MLKLGGFAVSNYYNKVKIALLEKGIPFEESLHLPSQDETLLARSPMGKMPFLELPDGQTLSESQVIVEYLEDAYPEKPLFPKDALLRARCRELIMHMELHLELVARRLYAEAFFGGKASDETKEAVRKDLAKGVRTLRSLAKLSPFLAGSEFTLVDCAAAVHLPLVALATKTVFGVDVLADFPEVKAYQARMFERPSVTRANADRKAFLEARK